MARLHLTDVVMQRLKTPGIYYDTTTPAFGVRVGKNRKTWIITRGKNRQRITIGHYGEHGMSLAEARKEAKKRLAEDPSDTSSISFDEAYENYKEHLKSRKPRTQTEYKRLMNKYFVPSLGPKSLTALAYEGVIECVKDVSKSEAAHALTVARAFFRWCIRPPRRYIPHSPLEGVEIKQSKKRRRVLEDPELKAAWNAAKKQGYPHGTIVQLLILTGQRRGEIANLRRPWINEKEQTITLPDWITKNKKEHTFPYGKLVADVLETVPRRNSTDLLFPSKRSDERPISGWSKFKKEMEDGVEGWRLHDLRRTMRTNHGKIGTPSEIAERLINHAAAVQTDVEAIYDVWTYLPPMKKAVTKYESHLSRLLAA